MRTCMRNECMERSNFLVLTDTNGGHRQSPGDERAPEHHRPALTGNAILHASPVWQDVLARRWRHVGGRAGRTGRLLAKWGLRERHDGKLVPVEVLYNSQKPLSCFSLDIQGQGRDMSTSAAKVDPRPSWNVQDVQAMPSCSTETSWRLVETLPCDYDISMASRSLFNNVQ